MQGPALSDVEIADCFNAGMGRRYQVHLVGGATEPLYEPASEAGPARIHYTLNYAASALHELAHWCIAGRQRRELPDYGYWYRPPPRSDAEQIAFFRVELPVQALECRLAEAAGVPFRISVDDLDRDDSTANQQALEEFRRRVLLLASDESEFSARARMLEADLVAHRLRSVA